MKNIINEERIIQITTFLKSLDIKSKRFSEMIKTKNISEIQNFNQAFIHSSEDKILNPKDSLKYLVHKTFQLFKTFIKH